MTIIYALLVFGVLIFIHELGHFTAAKLTKTKVNEFSVGMGPKLFSFHRGETIYALRPLPIGGFVKLEGEDEVSNDEDSFNNKTKRQRFFILVSGAAMNIILGFLLMLIIVSMTPKIASTQIAKFQDAALSNQAGLQVNDKIIKVNNDSVNVYMDAIFLLSLSNGENMDITVLRDGKKVLVPNVSFPKIEQDGITSSTIDFYFYAERKTPVSVIRQAFYQGVAMIRMVYKSLGAILSGKYGLKALSGPVGTTTAIGDAAKSGLDSLMFIMAFISINLGVVNLLPLPALDGGRIIFILIELIRGKPVKPEHEGYVHFAGIVLLMLLMVIVTFNDIVRLVTNTFK